MSSPTADDDTAPPYRALSTPEFVALTAMLFATIAFSMDAMLPALGEIGQELSPQAVNRAQLIVTSFVLGMGVGTLFSGPLSDAFGRRPIIFAGAALYIVGALLSWMAQSLEILLAARVIQGLGAAGPRVVALAIVRDLYKGRQMARIMSFAFLIFSLFPAVAPTLGAGLIWAFGWRAIFLSFVCFAIFSVGWLALRQPETHGKEHRRPLKGSVLWAGFTEVITDRIVCYSIAVQALGFGMLFAALSSTQPIFDITYGEGKTFHLWFGFISVVAATSSLLNAYLVERLGMRFAIKLAYAMQIGLAGLVAVIMTLDVLPLSLEFWVYVAWTITLFFQAGLTLGNINALAMENMGHLAGLTASVLGALSTVAATLIAGPLGLAFDGTPRPLAWGVFVCSILAYVLMRRLGNAKA